MATYLITHLRIPGGIPNEQGLAYLDQVEATMTPFGGSYIAQGVPAAILEGAWDGSVVLIQFPDRAAVDAWYESEAYQRILPLRTGSSIADTVVIDQLPADFSAKKFVASIRAKITASASA